MWTELDEGTDGRKSVRRGLFFLFNSFKQCFETFRKICMGSNFFEPTSISKMFSTSFLPESMFSSFQVSKMESPGPVGPEIHQL